MQQTKPFAPTHPWDRNFFLVMAVLIWFAIVSGFTNDIIKLKAEGRLDFPLITHIHGAVFVGWLVLFTTQIILIRRKNYSLHKKLGIAGAILATIMVILGAMTAINSEKVKFGTEFSDPAFLSIMLGDMLLFGTLVAAGIYHRKSSSSHKRLMLIATIVLTDAGFGRWLNNYIAPLFGDFYWNYHNFSDGFLPFIGFQLLLPFTLMLIAGIYDLITRRRFHPVYLWAVLWWFIVNIVMAWLYFSPEWLKVAKQLIGH